MKTRLGKRRHIQFSSGRQIDGSLTVVSSPLTYLFKTGIYFANNVMHTPSECFDCSFFFAVVHNVVEEPSNFNNNKRLGSVNIFDRSGEFFTACILPKCEVRNEWCSVLF